MALVKVTVLANNFCHYYQDKHSQVPWGTFTGVAMRILAPQLCSPLTFGRGTRKGESGKSLVLVGWLCVCILDKERK